MLIFNPSLNHLRRTSVRIICSTRLRTRLHQHDHLLFIGVPALRSQFNDSKLASIFNPRHPKGRGWLFQTTFFGNRRLTKRLYVIYTNHMTHLFTTINRNLGVPYGQGKSSRFSVELGWWNFMIFILPITKIFDKIILCLWLGMYIRISISLPILPKIPCACSYDFLA